MHHFLRSFLLVGTLLPALNLATPFVPLSIARTQAQPAPTTTPRVDVSRMRERLQARDWQAADAETRRLLQPWIHPNGDIFGETLATNIPPEVLQTIDRLWTEASGGRFGFTAQKRIWDAVRSQTPSDTNVTTRVFGDRVGWRRPTPDPNNFVSPEWLTEPELNYTLQAPVGHLPWAGVDWARVSAILQTQGCGSCMIDAMYLQGDRFSRHLPVLFNWLSTALTATLPPEGSWQQARLAYSINLRSLYANNSCPVYTLDQAISPNSAIVAISSYSYERACSGGTNNSTLALWNAERGTRIITLIRGLATESSSYQGQAQEPPTEGTRIVGDVANAIAFTPDNRFIVAGLSNGTIQIWTTDRGQVVRTLSGHRYSVRAIAISTNGQQLISASADQTIKVWNLQTGQLIRTLTLPPTNGIVHTLLLSADGRRVVTATERNALQLWDAQTGQLVRTLVAAGDLTSSRLPVAISPNGQLVATGDRDSSVKLWNATTGARLITLQRHAEPIQALAFSPNSQRLASSEPKTAYLWNLQTYQPVHTFSLIQSVGHPVQPNNPHSALQDVVLCISNPHSTSLSPKL